MLPRGENRPPVLNDKMHEEWIRYVENKEENEGKTSVETKQRL